MRTDILAPALFPYRIGPHPTCVFLNNQQALADLASFHKYATNRWNLNFQKNLWIAFGGSYPGALSSWDRLKYPHLIHGRGGLVGSRLGKSGLHGLQPPM